eukprot:TRINITY_DN14400_c0_g1_i1.p1 TRINITY_DN14400_c0_g1~~TRINITY_DN14400_c0_g1_i1.p1  ORF type:complete len:165 (-),score=54.49 TRINITY_DN14400_c0_g1_i1:264-758(-)
MGDPSDGSESTACSGTTPLMWVVEKTLEEVRQLVEQKVEVSKEKLEELVDPDEVADAATLVPLDTGDFVIEDLDDLIEAQGAAKVATMLISARKTFLDNIAAMQPAERDEVQQTLTGREYKEMMMEEMQRVVDGQEAGEEEQDDEVGDEDVEPEAPPQKRQKTD